MLEKALHRLREVERQVGGEDRFPIHLLHRLAPGRRRAGDEHAVVRQRLRERAHQRSRRTRFAYGHGVDPEELRRRVEAVMTQAFRDAFAVAGLAPPAPPEPQQDERQRKAQERGVELPHAHCLSTSEASGARPGAPTFFACGAPYSPLSAGSEPQ